MAVIYDMSHIDAMEGHEFEQFIANLLRKLGYQKVEVTPGSGDQGVDVLAEKDDIRYAMQCKCYASDLGNTPVQEVNTGKVIYHCHVGVVVTNRYFTQGAKEAAKATGVLLWDRTKLMALIAQAGMEIRTEISIQQKDMDVQKEDDERLTEAQERYERHNNIIEVILIYLSENSELAVTPHDIMEKVLRPCYPGEVWGESKVTSLLNVLCDKGSILIRVKDNSGNDAFMVNEAEHNRQKTQEVIPDYLSGNIELAVAMHDIMDIKPLTMAQERNEEYKRVIRDCLSANFEHVFTLHDIMEKILMPAYPNERWSGPKVASLLNALCKEGRIIRRGYDAFMVTEAEHRQQKAQEVILDYLSANPGLAVTAHDLIEKVLMPAYPNEPWNDTKAVSLLNALCDREGKLIYVKDNSGNDAFIITEAERRQKEWAEAERRRQEEERAEKRATLEAEQATLQMELTNLKGLFTGRRRREIEKKLSEIKAKLEVGKNDIPGISK